MTVPAPTSLRIGPHEFTVTPDPRLWHDTDCTGRTFIRYLEIRYDPSRPHTSVAETLLHETLHTVWWDAGLNESPVVPDEAEEHIVTAMSSGLLDALRSNPELVAFLTA